MNENNAEIQIYTDGSCHTQHKIGAWAAIILFDGKEILLNDIEINTTHNRMELSAVIKTLEFITVHHFEKQRIRVVTDSQYVVGIKNRKEKLENSDFKTQKGRSVQNVDLLKQLISLNETLDVEYVKIKAHQKKTDVRNYNREVDKISRKSVREYVKKNYSSKKLKKS